MIWRRFNFRIWWTRPVHLFDFILWWIIKLLWEPFSLKRSHWWHWKITKLPVNAKPLMVQGNEKEIPRNTSWRNFFQTNFGWQNVVVVGPFESLPTDLISRKGEIMVTLNIRTEPFQVGWNKPGNPKFKEGEFEMCTIVHSKCISLLIGPGVTNFFAQTLDGKPLPLSVLGYATKRGAFLKGYRTY